MFLVLPYLLSMLMVSTLLTKHVNLCNTHITPRPPHKSEPVLWGEPGPTMFRDLVSAFIYLMGTSSAIDYYILTELRKFECSTTRHFGQESEAVLPGEEPEQEGTPGEQLPLRNPTKGPLTKGLALPTQKARIKPQEGR